MGAINETDVLSALRQVRDPDLNRDIVALNFVKDLVIAGNDVSFAIELTTPSCPVRDDMKAAAAKAVKERVPGVGVVTVSMTSNVTRQQGKTGAEIIPGVKNTIAVASGKGGVGKSTVAVNLAVALALDGAKVGLIDADVYGPSIPMMMGVNRKPAMVNGKMQPIVSHGVQLMSIGFFVDPNDAMIWRGPMASGAVRQFLTDVDWGELDYLIFDLPPGTGDIQLTLVQTIPLTGAVIVTTPQDVSLADARKGLKMFEKVNVPVFGIVENMSYYVCSHCGHREEIFAHGGGRKTAEDLGIPFLGEIPIYTSIRVAGDKGIPAVADPKASVQADVIRTIARSLAAQISINNAGGTDTPGLEIDLG
ncbi:MAG: iron-sulfur cluster carrier protein ApbC [Bacteroidota bacterium]